MQLKQKLQITYNRFPLLEHEIILLYFLLSKNGNMKKGIINLAMGVVLLLSLFALKLLADFSNQDAQNAETKTIEQNNDSQAGKVE